MQSTFAYLRVSSEGQAKDGYGLSAQKTAIENYARKNGLTVTEFFADEGVSGALQCRPALLRLFSALEQDEVHRVVILRLDRLARDLMVQENLISDFQKRGAQLISVDEPDLCSSDPTRTLFRQMKGAIAEYEKSMITLRMSAGRLAKAAQGGYAGGAVPYGYRIRDGKHQPEETEAKTIRRIFAMRRKQRSTGKRLSLRSIAERLNTESVPAPGCSRWNPQSVSRILSNEAYKGTLKYSSSLVSRPEMRILSR